MRNDQDEVPPVRDLLPPPADPELAACLAELFRLDELMDKRILLLSSGEMRRFQLYKALAGAPRVLIVDNPFIGLDAPTREMLSELLGELARTGMIQMVLVVSRPEDIPPFVTHVVPVADKTVLPKVALADYLAARRPAAARRGRGRGSGASRACRPGRRTTGWDEVVRLSGVSIRYGGRTILDRLDWVVRRGRVLGPVRRERGREVYAPQPGLCRPIPSPTPATSPSSGGSGARARASGTIQAAHRLRQPPRCTAPT